MRLTQSLAAGLFVTAGALAQVPLVRIDSDAGGFGTSVELHGEQLFVAATFDDAAGPNSGLIYAFDANTGAQLFTVSPPNHGVADYFGHPLDAVGGSLVVGDILNDDQGSDAGSAYVFDAASGQLLFQLYADDAQADDFFGSSVATDGVRVVVGAPREGSQGALAGAAYVFDVATGQQLYKLVGTDTDANDAFGSSVAIDGDRVVVGAENHNDTLPGQGAAYVFDAATGQQLFELIAQDAAVDQQFGWSVGLDAAHVVVGAPQDGALGVDAGAAYVFDRQTGQQLNKLVEPGGGANQKFGRSLDADAGRVLIGSANWIDSEATTHLFDLASGQVLLELPRPAPNVSPAYGMFFSLAGARAAMGSGTEKVAYVQLALETLGARYCSPAVPNSSGTFGRIEAAGSVVASDDVLHLAAIDLPPGQFGYFVTGKTPGFSANPGGSQGNFCLGGSFGRYAAQVQNTGALGTLFIEVDLSAAPVTPNEPMLAGQTWHFQAWYRDLNPGPTSNFTDAVSVTFQ